MPNRPCYIATTISRIKFTGAKTLGVGFLRLGTRNRMSTKQDEVAQDLLSATPRVPDDSAKAGDADVRVPKALSVEAGLVAMIIGFLRQHGCI